MVKQAKLIAESRRLKAFLWIFLLVTGQSPRVTALFAQIPVVAVQSKYTGNGGNVIDISSYTGATFDVRYNAALAVCLATYTTCHLSTGTITGNQTLASSITLPVSGSLQILNTSLNESPGATVNMAPGARLYGGGNYSVIVKSPAAIAAGDLTPIITTSNSAPYFEVDHLTVQNTVKGGTRMPITAISTLAAGSGACPSGGGNCVVITGTFGGTGAPSPLPSSCASNACAGYTFGMFTDASLNYGNDGYFNCVASSTSSLTLQDATGVANAALAGDNYVSLVGGVAIRGQQFGAHIHDILCLNADICMMVSDNTDYYSRMENLVLYGIHGALYLGRGWNSGQIHGIQAWASDEASQQTGTVTASGSTVTWQSGSYFSSGSYWASGTQTMTLAGVGTFTIASCSSLTSCTMTKRVGTVSRPVAYSTLTGFGNAIGYGIRSLVTASLGIFGWDIENTKYSVIEKGVINGYLSDEGYLENGYAVGLGTAANLASLTLGYGTGSSHMPVGTYTYSAPGTGPTGNNCYGSHFSMMNNCGAYGSIQRTGLTAGTTLSFSAGVQINGGSSATSYYWLTPVDWYFNRGTPISAGKVTNGPLSPGVAVNYVFAPTNYGAQCFDILKNTTNSVATALLWQTCVGFGGGSRVYDDGSIAGVQNPYYNVRDQTAEIRVTGAIESGAIAFGVSNANVETCSRTLEGRFISVTDSTTNTPGATVTGGGSYHIQARCNGTSWVMSGF